MFHCPPDMKYKWLDDLSVLEVVNLLTIGISSYNVRHHVPSDVPVHNGCVESKKLKTQENFKNIADWTESKQMKLNLKKSHAMVFNFTQNFQFTSRLTLGGESLNIVEETKILGIILTNDLRWSKNTEYLIRRANARMEILRKLSSFNAPVKDMIVTYFLYIRSILEQSSVI